MTGGDRELTEAEVRMRECLEWLARDLAAADGVAPSDAVERLGAALRAYAPASHLVRAVVDGVTYTEAARLVELDRILDAQRLLLDELEPLAAYPARAGDRRTVEVAGKPYHWVERRGRLALRPGLAP